MRANEWEKERDGMRSLYCQKGGFCMLRSWETKATFFHQLIATLLIAVDVDVDVDIGFHYHWLSAIESSALAPPSLAIEKAVDDLNGWIRSLDISHSHTNPNTPWCKSPSPFQFGLFHLIRLFHFILVRRTKKTLVQTWEKHLQLWNYKSSL